jgi:type III pantothenate kinase
VTLLVDAGNSRIKWRVRMKGDVLSVGELPTDQFDRLEKVWEGMSLGEDAVLCSVANSQVNRMIELCLGRRLRRSPHWLRALPEGHGVVNSYRPPESLGADRFAALVAAHRREARDQVVVDVGTALTADMLTADGHFLGGCIVPGPRLMRDALKAGTAGVKADIFAPAEDWPRSTESAVDYGIGLALSGVVEGMRQRLLAAVGNPPRILITGGARPVLRPLLRGDVVEIDELVLEGLAWIARDLGFDA